MGDGHMKVADKVIGVAIVALLIAALTPTILAAFTNLSGSGIALAGLFSTVLGILYAVFALKSVWSGLR